MIVEVHVAPRNIDSLYVGLPVRVRLTAYNQRTLPPLDGELRYVSADQQIDERTGDPYFVARASIDPESIANAPEEVQLHPGMPAEVVIVTGERRVIDYLAAPLDVRSEGHTSELQSLMRISYAVFCLQKKTKQA